MRNRAKCKLCEAVVESRHVHDLVECGCGEISVDGGLEYFKCSAKNPENFLRVDDEDNIIVPKWVEREPGVVEEKLEKTADRLTNADHLSAVNSMIEAIERLPDHEMMKPITHYDYYSMLLLVREVLRSRERLSDRTDQQSP